MLCIMSVHLLVAIYILNIELQCAFLLLTICKFGMSHNPSIVCDMQGPSSGRASCLGQLCYLFSSVFGKASQVMEENNSLSNPILILDQQAFSSLLSL